MSLFQSKSKLFAEIQCPLGQECLLGNCIYSHNFKPSKTSKSNLETASHAASSCPPTKRPADATCSQHNKLNKIQKTLLTPKLITNPPSIHNQRVQFVNVLRDKLVENGYHDCDTRAIELEAEIAERSTKFTYSMGIRTAVREINNSKAIGSDLSSSAKSASESKIYLNELVNLLIPTSVLQQRRYVLEIPDSTPLKSTSSFPCARCSTSFLIFHSPSTSTECRFHLLKRQYDPSKKRLSTVWPCCHKALEESNGCESRNFHVYKLEQPSIMNSVLPFRKPSKNPNALFAAGVDCEMAWTTRGFELIRVTVVDYESEKCVYDRLVWPLGDILDLNTRFSGVSNMNNGIIGETGERIMPVTLDTMYEQLSAHISEATILIGHGLENDLNVLRLIHKRIVDTAILLPRNRTRTFSLKELAWEYLGRNIQTGEHNSMEDALAAIDIIKEDIRRRCIPPKSKN